MILFLYATKRLQKPDQDSFDSSNGYYPVSLDLLPRQPGDIHLCYAMPAFVPHGGIEQWFKTLHALMKENQNLNNMGFYIWDIRTLDMWEYQSKTKIMVLTEYKQLERFCHIVISTAFRPTKDAINILAIHGGEGCKWTRRYAQYSRLYHYLVGVSMDSKSNVDPEEQSRVVTIPSLVTKSTVNDNPPYRFCDKQLLFVGRISSEKRPKLFCEALCNLKDYCGVVIGPAYFTDNLFHCPCSNVYYLGKRSDTQEFMRNSDLLLVPSESEGGPIVAIESWLNRLPVIMKKTGLAKQFPQAFIYFDWDNPNYKHLLDLLTDTNLKQEAVKNGYEIYDTLFSKNIVSKKWDGIINKSIESLMSEGHLYKLKVIANVLTSSRTLGKTIILDCMQDACQTTIRFDHIVSSFCFDYESTGPNLNIKVLVTSMIYSENSSVSQNYGRLCFKMKTDSYFHLDINMGLNQLTILNIRQ